MTTDQLTVDLSVDSPVDRARTHPLRRQTREPAWGRMFRKVLIGSDLFAIALAVLISTALMTPGDLNLVGTLRLPYPAAAIALGLIWVLTLGAGGSRNPWITGAGLEEYRRIIKASLYVFGAVAIISYILKAQFSRSLFILLLPVGILLLLFGRWVARAWINRTRLRGENLTPCAVVGPTAQVERVITDLKRHIDAGFEPVAVYLLDGDNGPAAVDGIPTYSANQFLSTAEESTNFDAVIATEGLPNTYLRQLAWHLESSSTALVITPRVTDIIGPRAHYTDTPGMSLIHVDIPQFTGWKFVTKRSFDILFSTIALIALAPVFALIAILIKLDDHGPVIFRQERVGLDGQTFTMYKFRSMCVDAEKRVDQLITHAGGQGTLFKMKEDPRVTRVGKYLRHYSLDELPQFWSCLRGDMSVVGPRPALPREVAVYEPTHRRRLLIKPGITGLWQVSGRSDLSPEESIRLDLRYVENWSPTDDFTIILKTVLVATKGSGAY